MPASHFRFLDQYKHDLQKMISCLSELVLFLSYRCKKSTLWDTLPKLALLPWQQETQTSLCWSSFMATKFDDVWSPNISHLDRP